MAFNSIEFLIFLIVVFASYFIIKHKYRHYVLLVASYYFYMRWNVKLVFLILFTTLTSFVFAILIEKNENVKKRKLFLALSLICSLGALFFFKYYNFLAESIQNIISSLGGTPYDLTLNIILPVGISFYTFQTLSYVIDVYKGKIQSERNIFYFALYVSYFPQLVAGPIERPENLLPQLKEEHKIEKENISSGLKMMLVGFVKKVCIADICAIYVNKIYNDVGNVNGLLVVLGTILFGIQILCDFSGYSDIAIGCSKLFGIDLMKNFDHPYKSQTIKEFWNRWHISLSSWLRDYIYFPLGGSRCSMLRWCLNITVVFLASGLWHGASWTFVIWGLIHAVYQIIGRFTLNIRNKLWNGQENKIPVKIWRIVNTYILVTFAWIFFRINSFNDLGILFTKLFTEWNFNKEYFKYIYSFLELDVFKIIYLILIVSILWSLDYIKEFKDENLNTKYFLHMTTYLLCMIAVVTCFIYLKESNVASSFIYFQF